MGSAGQAEDALWRRRDPCLAQRTADLRADGSVQLPVKFANRIEITSLKLAYLIRATVRSFAKKDQKQPASRVPQGAWAKQQALGSKSKPARATQKRELEPQAFLACAHGINLEKCRLHGPIPEHPECYERVEACAERLRANAAVWPLLRNLDPRRATDAEILLCHEEAHLRGLEKLAAAATRTEKPQFVPSRGPVCISGPGSDLREEGGEGDTYVTAGTLEAARYSVGGLLEAVDEMLRDGLQCGLILCRPPGHHASKNRSSGFCLVNNIAVAAAYALRRPEVSRVLIFDWDVHHGQGTQQIFEHSSEVLFVSVHRHDGTSFYPATGVATEAGFGAGKGATVNVALPAGYGDLALWSACAQVLLPATRSFKPDLILVSAGFDAAEGDPLGGCSVAPQMFGVLTRELRRLAAETAGGRLAFALEGGYNTECLARCVEEVATALVETASVGEPFADTPDWLKGPPCHGAIRRTCEVHKGPPRRLAVPPSKKERRKPQEEVHNAPEGDSAEKNFEEHRAVVEVTGAELRVRIAPLPRPCDVLVSRNEIQVSLAGADVSSPQRWWLSGANITEGARETATYHRGRSELVITTGLGEILGGPMQLLLAAPEKSTSLAGVLGCRAGFKGTIVI
ncbi:hda-6 [Symbiodinium sp. CCMP2592]|nr:hda-6 [Symbiodinium sp. CCMP2592]